MMVHLMMHLAFQVNSTSAVITNMAVYVDRSKSMPDLFMVSMPGKNSGIKTDKLNL